MGKGLPLSPSPLGRGPPASLVAWTPLPISRTWAPTEEQKSHLAFLSHASAGGGWASTFGEGRSQDLVPPHWRGLSITCGYRQVGPKWLPLELSTKRGCAGAARVFSHGGGRCVVPLPGAPRVPRINVPLSLRLPRCPEVGSRTETRAPRWPAVGRSLGQGCAEGGARHRLFFSQHLTRSLVVPGGCSLMTLSPGLAGSAARCRASVYCVPTSRPRA